MRYIGSLLLVLALTIGCGYWLLVGGAGQQAVIENGILDLSQPKLGTDQLLSLRGEWMFQQWKDGEYSPPVPVQVPGYWADIVIDGKPIGHRAIGRYELKILTKGTLPTLNKNRRLLPPPSPPPFQDGLGPKGPRPGGPLTLLMPSSFGNAYTVQTGILPPLARDGVIDLESSESRAGYSHSSLAVPVNAVSNDTLTLRITMANHHSHFGGMAAAPLLGFQPVVERFRLSWSFTALFAMSLLVGFSIFSLGLFLIFRRRKLLLYASLFSLVGLLRLSFSDAMLIQHVSTALPWNFVMTIRLLTMPYLAFTTGVYVLEFFQHRPTVNIRRFLTWGIGVITTLVVLLPPFPKSYMAYPSQFYMLATIGCCLWLLIRDRNSERNGIRELLFVGMLTPTFIIAQFVNFYGGYAVRSTQTYGILGVAAGMAFLVLKDVMRLNQERTALTTDLQSANNDLSDLTKSLETKVATRTQELAERNEQLEALQRFRRRTNAMIIHDLKNPLQVILSNGKADQSPDNRIQNAGRRMLLMVQNLLDVDRAEQASLLVRPERLLLADLVRDAVDRQHGLLVEKGIQLTNEIDPAAKILSDRVLTERVIDNILHNAVKYTPEQGSITLSINTSNTLIELFCDDSGPGVPPALRDQIFTDYATDQIESSAYGLGLSFVRTAMEAIGGSVLVSAPESGIGGRFVLAFPAVLQQKIERPLLTKVDLTVLAPFLPTLQGIPVYQASAIEEVLVSIPDGGNLLAWKQAVQEAMYAGEEAAYLALLA